MLSMHFLLSELEHKVAQLELNQQLCKRPNELETIEKKIEKMIAFNMCA